MTGGGSEGGSEGGGGGAAGGHQLAAFRKADCNTLLLTNWLYQPGLLHLVQHLLPRLRLPRNNNKKNSSGISV
jgi:hypothetical protein